MTRRPELRALDAVALACVLAVLGLGGLVSVGAADPFDLSVARTLDVAAENSPRGLLRPITELGSTWAITALAVLLVGALAVIGRVRLGLIAAGAIAMTTLLNTTAKEVLARSRPEALDPLVQEHGFSFPSGHALLSATAYGIVAVLLARSSFAWPVRVLGVAALTVVVALIGLSRVYLSVHHPTDVLAGWIAGIAVVAVYARLTARGEHDVTDEPVAPRTETGVTEDAATP